MSYSTKNLLANPNLSISNSIILNNYLIQNIIMSPSKIDSYEKGPSNINNYLKRNASQICYSPSSNISIIKNIHPHDSGKYNLYNNITPLKTNKSMSRINCKRQIPIHQNKEIFPELISKTIIEKNIEKHPQDSVKKKLVKKITIMDRNNKKLLKTSISSRILKPIKNPIKGRYDLKIDTSFPRNNLSKKKKIKKVPTSAKIIYLEPKGKLNLKEFQFGEQIGKGTFGKIFSVKWIKNNRYYAMKKEILKDIEDVEKRKNTCKIIQNFIKNTGNRGVINLYGNLCFIKSKNNINNKNNDGNEFIYYELMEKAERDWDKEINFRRQHLLYYTEKELMNIMSQLITTLSLMEKNHITHRDIKPQNILILKGKYKLADFGEIRVLKRDGLIVQRVRGSELYMSPILFHGLHLNLLQVKHNTYKSDVFSLGMCLFYAASLTYSGVDEIRELTDIKKIKNILFQYLGERYSTKFILFILSLLEIDETKRLNFIKLEEKLKNFEK